MVVSERASVEMVGSLSMQQHCESKSPTPSKLRNQLRKRNHVAKRTAEKTRRKWKREGIDEVQGLDTEVPDVGCEVVNAVGEINSALMCVCVGVCDRVAIE